MVAISILLQYKCTGNKRKTVTNISPMNAMINARDTCWVNATTTAASSPMILIILFIYQISNTSLYGEFYRYLYIYWCASCNVISRLTGAYTVIFKKETLLLINPNTNSPLLNIMLMTTATLIRVYSVEINENVHLQYHITRPLLIALGWNIASSQERENRLAIKK